MTQIFTIMVKMGIINNLHHGVKIGKMGTQVTGTTIAATFSQVCHTYMIIHAIIDKIIFIKLVDLSFTKTTRLISCKNTI